MELFIKCVGLRYYTGILKVNETVELQRETDSQFPKAIGVYNAEGIKCGSVANKIPDFDNVVNGIKSNLQIYNDIESYSWVVKRVTKFYALIVGIEKSDEIIELETSIKELSMLVKTHQKNLRILNFELEIAKGNQDVITVSHLKNHIDFLQNLHDVQSNEIVALKNQKMILEGDTRENVFGCAK